MRTLALIVTIAGGSIWLAFTCAQDPSNSSGQKEGPKFTGKVKELQKERIAALKSAAEIEASLYQRGTATPEAMLEAKVLVCEAELDAAEKKTEQITALKNLVDVLKEHEELAQARKRAARATESEVLKFKARRLEAEIRLERAQDHAQAKNVEPVHEKVIVTTVQAKDVDIAEQFVCQVRSRRHIEVRTQQPGYLEAIQVKEGQTVKQGDVLFKIAPFLYKAKLDAELAEVELATLNLKNTEKLFQSKVVSENEVALFKAKLASAEAKARLAQAELGLTMIRAPFDGIIDRLHEHEGSLVTERDVLTTLSDNSLMWVYFNVPQSSYLEYMSNPSKDEDIAAELVLANGGKFSQPGKIAAIEAEFNSQTGTIPFRADFPNPDALLRHGMTGTLQIQRTLKGAVVIPQKATFENLGKRYVYVVDKDGLAQQREIVVQKEQADNFVIKQGLDVNEKIVVEGVGQSQDGRRVQQP